MTRWDYHRCKQRRYKKGKYQFQSFFNETVTVIFYVFNLYRKKGDCIVVILSKDMCPQASDKDTNISETWSWCIYEGIPISGVCKSIDRLKNICVIRILHY